MRKLILALCLASIVAGCETSRVDAAVMPGRDTVQFKNQDPFNTQSTPAPAPTPVVPNVEVKPVFQMPQPGESWFTWIMGAIVTLLGSVMAGSHVKMAFAPPVTPVSGAPHAATPTNERLERIESILAQTIGSGVPGQLLQTGISLIPGAGPIAATAEPIFRKVVLDLLTEKNTDPAHKDALQDLLARVLKH